MTITRRPPRATKPKTAVPAADKDAETFIEDAPHPTPVPEADSAKASKKKEKHKEKEKGKKGKAKEHGKKKDKEAVLIRFEDEQLTLMDAAASALGLSRAAWVRMVVAKALMADK
jgi:predicted DNA binding CopG/RHH family protein